MMKTYTKPVVTIDNGMAEGVYAASGANQGKLKRSDQKTRNF